MGGAPPCLVAKGYVSYCFGEIGPPRSLGPARVGRVPPGRRPGGRRRVVGRDGLGAGLVGGRMTGACAGEPLIELRDAAFGWRGRPAVHGVSGGFAAGSMTAVAGPNGAGKSTLIKGIVGLMRPLAGTLRIAGGARRGLAWLPQAADLDRAFPITVLDMVAMGAWRRVGPWRRFNAAETERAWQALESVGLVGEAGRIVGSLSGGQMQRALFARLMLQDAQVLLLDEPFAAVDSHTADALMRLLCAWHAEGRTVVAVLHDLALVRRHFGQTLLLAGRQVAWGPTAEVLTPGHLAAARGAPREWL